MTRIETYRVFGLYVVLACGAATIAACSDDNAGTGSTGTAGGSTSASGTSATTGTGAGGATGTGTSGTGGSGNAAVAYCAGGPGSFKAPVPTMNALISDFDGDSGMPDLVQAIMPGGKWDDDVDTTGTPDNMSIKFEPCGTTGVGMHFIGVGHTKWGADAAAAIIDQLNPADVSQYSGISFVIKSAVGQMVIFKVQNPYSQPGCGKCVETNPLAGEECYSGYTKNVPTTTDATPQVVKWTELTQQMWGFKPLGTAAFDPKNLISIAFAFNGGMDFDVCIDDVKFVP